MSFYQNDDQNKSDKDFSSYSPLQEQLRREEEEKKSRQKNKNRGAFGYFFVGFFGVIVGALLVWLLMIPSLEDDSGSIANNRTENTPKITQTATEVTTDVTKKCPKPLWELQTFRKCQTSGRANHRKRRPAAVQGSSIKWMEAKPI